MNLFVRFISEGMDLDDSIIYLKSHVMTDKRGLKVSLWDKTQEDEQSKKS